MHSILLETINSTLTCHIFPRSKYPDGLYLTYETCPEVFDNHTAKIVRYCCLNIMISIIQDSFYKKTQDWLRYNSSSILVGPAVIFNILSLLVLTKFNRFRNISKNSTTFYMKCLCIFDTSTIVSKFLNELIVVRNGLRQEPWVINSFMCKLLSFSESCFAISSIYILIAMSFEKLICVIMPLKVGMILTRFKAKIAFFSIFLVSTLVSSYNLFDRRVFIFEWFEKNEKNYPNSSENFFRNSSISSNNFKRVSYDCDSKWPNKKNDWLLINNIIRVFLPIILLCICNFWIIIALTKAKRKSKILFNSNTYPQEDKKNSSAQLFQFSQNQKSSFLLIKQFPSKQRNLTMTYDRKLDGNFKSKKNTQHISIMLVAVSVGFIFCNLPFALRTLFHRYFSERFKLIDYLYYSENLFILTTSRREILNSVKYEFFSSLTHLLLDLNYIMNFFLFFLSGSRFRSQLFTILKYKKKLDPNKSNIFTKNFRETNNFDTIRINRLSSNFSMNKNSEMKKMAKRKSPIQNDNLNC